jgi:outer membrane murein-binding lipoprotein Lpp
MADPDNLEARVTALEQSIDRVRSDVIQANTKSAMADIGPVGPAGPGQGPA